jgi:hypothetical protein
LALSFTTVGAARREHITFSAAHKQIDAQFEAWPLEKVLATLAAATGWRVYVVPDTEDTITASFKQLDTADALQRLLGAFNFALLPQADGSTALFVFRRSADEATRLVAQANPASRLRPGAPIPGELVVVLKAGARESIEELTKRVGARVVGRLARQRAYRLAFHDDTDATDARRRLAGDADVESLEQNLVIAAPAELAPMPEAHAPALTLEPDVSPSKTGVVVGLIDSPVQAQGSPIEGFMQPGVSVFGDYREPSGDLTHGTAMAETILDGVQQALGEAGRADAKINLSIIPIDVYGGNEQTSSFDVAQGVAAALERHANIVNLSLGGDSQSALLQNLIASASRQGTVFVAAAGNDPVTTPFYPAADPGVLSVTAADDRGSIAPYANRGSWVDALGPGSNVVTYGGQTWLGSGTSFSSGWVSGWAAGTMVGGMRQAGAVERRVLDRFQMPGAAPSAR